MRMALFFCALFRETSPGKEQAMNKEKVKKYLETHCKGEKNALTAACLRAELGISEKELRKQIHMLRLEGVPIASGGRGYFYARTAAEVYATVRFLERLRDAINAAIQGLIKSLNGFGDVS